MEIKDGLLEQASKIENQYKEGINYKKKMGFLDKWAECERFKAGDQWAAPTPKTKNLPRPVVNIIAQTENHKISSVMNENIKMVFSAMDAEEGSDEFQSAELFTRYAETTWENVKQDALNEEALESAANVGTGIWHYYFDNDVVGGNSLKYKGQIKGEVIDIVNFFPGNPQNKDVQEQPYILITYRELLSNVRKQAEQNGIPKEMIALIRSDNDTQDQTYDMAKEELSTSNKVTVITKYWKVFQIPAVKPTVHFMKVASGVVFKPDTDMRISLYPIAVMQWERRKRSIFGMSNTEQLIGNQKSINFLYAMQILSSQLTGWPKMIVDRNAVKQKSTNTPGEIINVDGNPGEASNAVHYLNPSQMPAYIPNLIQMFTSETRSVAGANENALGEQSYANQPASSIIALQRANGIPLESIKRRFYQAMEDVGLIWAEFWKTYFNTDRMIKLKDDNGEEYLTVFNGSQHQNADMSLKIDIGASSVYSESLMMASLDKLFDKGDITFEQYLKYAPRNVIPFKDSLLKSIQQQQEQNQQNQFQQLLNQLSPEEQQAFMKASPEQQQALMQQLLGQQSNTQPQQTPRM
jgi:polyhydroxyalkanoate synthesis regulator phasin